jgi:hypothetical protein
VRTGTLCSSGIFIQNGICSDPSTPQIFEFDYFGRACYGDGWRLYTLQTYPIAGTSDYHGKSLDSKEIPKGAGANCPNRTGVFDPETTGGSLVDCFYPYPAEDITLTVDDFVVTYDETDAGTTYKCGVNPADNPNFPEWIKLSTNPLP